MKDYTYLYSYIKEDSKDEKFIKNYDYSNGNIIVNQIKNKQYTVPNNIDEEKKLLDRMKSQYLKIKCVYDIIKQRSDLEISSFLYCLVFVIGVTVFITASIFQVHDPSFLIILSTLDGLSIIVDTAIITKAIKTKIILKDFEKNKLFVENDDIINKSLNNDNLLNNTSEKTKEIVEESINNSEFGITLNTIDKIKLKELRQILENIKENDNIEKPIQKVKK